MQEHAGFLVVMLCSYDKLHFFWFLIYVLDLLQNEEIGSNLIFYHCGNIYPYIFFKSLGRLFSVMLEYYYRCISSDGETYSD